MIINRRTYHNVPGKFGDLLDLAKEFRALTRQELNKDFRILNAAYGPMATIVLEFEYKDAAEQEEIQNGWHQILSERGMIEKWFQLVQSASNELWFVQE